MKRFDNGLPEYRELHSNNHPRKVWLEEQAGRVNPIQTHSMRLLQRFLFVDRAIVAIA